MSDTDTKATSEKPNRTLRLALIGSLVVNLLLVGIVTGSVVGGRMHGDGRDGPDVGFGPLTKALDREDRRALFKDFMAKAPDFKAERAASKADFLALADALRADPWDRAAVEAILARQGQRGMERLERGRALLVDHIAAMSPEDRAAFADRIVEVLSRRGDKGPEAPPAP